MPLIRCPDPGTPATCKSNMSGSCNRDLHPLSDAFAGARNEMHLNENSIYLVTAANRLAK